MPYQRLRSQLLLLGLRTLLTVLGTALHTTLNTLGVERTADDVVTHAGEVLDTAAADQNDAVLLQVVADTGDVGGNLIAIRQADTGDLTKCGVRLLGGHRLYDETHSTTLRALLQRRRF